MESIDSGDQNQQSKKLHPVRPLRKRQKQHIDGSLAVEAQFNSDAESLEELDRCDEPIASRSSLSQLQYIVQELLTSELAYIDMLSIGIANYLSIFEQDTLRATVQIEKYHLFANIDDIRAFHANIFYPSLLACGGDLEHICRRFYDFIAREDFYLYIRYAINRKRSEQLCEDNQAILLERQQQSEDKLGIGSFLMQPIQRLPKYQLLLHQMVKELQKEPVTDGTNEKLDIAFKTEMSVQRLLDRVNSSMIINDIEDCIEMRMLYSLVGTFLNQHEFDIVDADQKRRYRGRVFFFATCIIYTEALARTKLQYRGYYMYSDIGIAYQEGKNKFCLYRTKRGNNEIECLSELNSIPSWTASLNEVMKKALDAVAARMREGYRNEDADEINCSTSDYGMIRTTVVNGQLSNGNSDIWGGISKCTASTVGYEFQMNLRRTNWYTNAHTPSGLDPIKKMIARLLRNEKHYIQTLIEYMMSCLRLIPDIEKTHQVTTYIQIIGRIIEYHQNHIYPAFVQCNGNIMKIYNEFQIHAKNQQIQDTYRLYATLACRAQVTFATRNCKKKFKHIGMKQLQRYHKFFERLIFKTYHRSRTEFQALVLISNAFAERHYNFIDNWNLYAINTKNHFPEYGLVEDSESVEIDGDEHRLLLLQRGIVCVRTKISKKKNRDEFENIVFWMPWMAVRTVTSKLKPVRLKFFSAFAKQDVFKLDFELEHVREKVQGIILGVQIMNRSNK